MNEDSGTGDGGSRSTADLVDAPSEARIDSLNGRLPDEPAFDPSRDSSSVDAATVIEVESTYPRWVLLLLTAGYLALGVYCLREAWFTLKEYKNAG